MVKDMKPYYVLHINPWDYAREAGRSNGDSAVCLYWNEQELSEGDTLSCKTFYGLSALQQDLRPPLAVALTGATRLEVVKNKDGKEEYSPNPYTVTAYIQNIGTGTATNARITLNLPSGMEIVEGDKTVDLGDIPVGTKQYQVSWKVKVAPSPVDKTEKYGVTVVADNADEKTLEREIFIPKLENENAVKLEIIKSQLQDGSHINLNLKLTNISKDSLDMRNYAIRYYLTDEQPRQEKAINFYNMAINGKQYKYINPSIASNISGQFKSNLTPTRDKADSYIQIALGKNVNELAKVAPGDIIWKLLLILMIIILPPS
jgi:hypothetical protein